MTILDDWKIETRLYLFCAKDCAPYSCVVCSATMNTFFSKCMSVAAFSCAGLAVCRDWLVWISLVCIGCAVVTTPFLPL
jgi:hypothetical protein